MKKVAVALASGLLAFNMSGCGAKSSGEVAVRPNTSATPSISAFDLLRTGSTLTSEQVIQIEHAHKRNAEYWRARGELAVASTTVVALHGDKLYRCNLGDGVKVIMQPSNPLAKEKTSRICQDEQVPTNNVSVITAQSINRRTTGILSIYFGTAHELGHAYQAVKDPTFWSRVRAANDDPQARLELESDEQNATCWAGATLATYLTGPEIETLREEIAQFPSNTGHSTGEQQAAAFMTGVAEGTC